MGWFAVVTETKTPEVKAGPKAVCELPASAVALPTLPCSVTATVPSLLLPAPGKLLSSTSWEADRVIVVTPVVV